MEGQSDKKLLESNVSTKVASKTINFQQENETRVTPSGRLLSSLAVSMTSH